VDRKNFLEYFMLIDRPLRSYLMSITRNAQDTDDLLQGVWKTLWEKLDEFDETRSFRAWAFGVARVESLRWRQNKARSREVFSEEIIALLADTAAEAADEMNIRHSFLMDCVDKLDSVQRHILHMKYGQKMISRDIAVKIGRSVSAIDMTLVRVRRLLRDCIEDRMAETAR
jgi:RNA polymerase sigma-70 factor, ECF subfamily